ncbi:MAG: hypothetical protein R3B47_17080 [Bacteroidia bacterium]
MRFPLNKMYDCKDIKLVAGAYAPLSLSRTFMGAGLHLRWDRSTRSGVQESGLSLAATLMPSLYYANTTVTDKAFGTAGLRISYAPELFGKGDQTFTFNRHKFEIGGHLDTHIDRSISLDWTAISRRNSRGGRKG